MTRYRITPNMMPTFRLTADSPGRALVQNGRMFAMLNMIADDTGMATAEARLQYNFRATDHSDPQRRVGCHGTVSCNPGDGDHHAAIAQGTKKEALKP